MKWLSPPVNTNVTLLFSDTTFSITEHIVSSTPLLIALSVLSPNCRKFSDSLNGFISIAVLFKPAKIKVQKFVDKKFFRIAYDYRLALNQLNKELGNVLSEKELFKKVIDFIQGIVPLEKIGYFSFDNIRKIK